MFARYSIRSMRNVITEQIIPAIKQRVMSSFVMVFGGSGWLVARHPVLAGAFDLTIFLKRLVG